MVARGKGLVKRALEPRIACCAQVYLWVQKRKNVDLGSSLETWYDACMRGIRGATTVSNNTSQAIFEATRELLVEMLRENAMAENPDQPTALELEVVASIIFTVTPDLNAAFPAEAARNGLGMKFVPLLNALEIPVPGRLERAIRVMMHVNTTRSQREIHHVYLRDAVVLRPDLESAQ
jgi:chorismate mutase